MTDQPEVDPFAHDPARCATCRGVTPWTPERRRDAELRSLRSGRRIIDLPEELAA